MKPKENKKAENGAGYDSCQTPPEAFAPLAPFIDPAWRVWEPATGEGHLAAAIAAHGCDVHRSDWLTGQNFFEYTPAVPFDVLITNPPYSIKFDWLARCYALGKPFALLVPLETLGAATAQKLTRHYGCDVLLLDRRVNFKMPSHTTFGKGGAQFPVVWLCWRLLPAPICYGHVPTRSEALQARFVFQEAA